MLIKCCFFSYSAFLKHAGFFFIFCSILKNQQNLRFKLSSIPSTNPGAGFTDLSKLFTTLKQEQCNKVPNFYSDLQTAQLGNNESRKSIILRCIALSYYQWHLHIASVASFLESYNKTHPSSLPLIDKRISKRSTISHVFV